MLRDRATWPYNWTLLVSLAAGKGSKNQTTLKGTLAVSNTPWILWRKKKQTCIKNAADCSGSWRCRLSQDYFSLYLSFCYPHNPQWTPDDPEPFPTKAEEGAFFSVGPLWQVLKRQCCNRYKTNLHLNARFATIEANTHSLVIWAKFGYLVNWLGDNSSASAKISFLGGLSLSTTSDGSWASNRKKERSSRESTAAVTTRQQQRHSQNSETKADQLSV